MRPLQISPDTAVRLSKALGVPLEQLMHMPQHILIQKLVELEKQNKRRRIIQSCFTGLFYYFLLYHG
ncbi:YycC family protein [Bacillus cereus]|nr:YycC family protein [Bacillus cereus]